jgi:hypothetical protein
MLLTKTNDFEVSHFLVRCDYPEPGGSKYVRKYEVRAQKTLISLNFSFSIPRYFERSGS